MKNRKAFWLTGQTKKYWHRKFEWSIYRLLDSDDVWLPNKLEEQLYLFDDKKVAVVYSNYEKMNENGERGNRIIKAPSGNKLSGFIKR